jgi:type II secretory pathway pseudopilin PulG
MIEILVVVGIIAILIGILVPALTMVQKSAKIVKQRAQFTAIDLGLAAFRSDYGDYPPSSWWNPTAGPPEDTCGAQKLAEALLGWDLLGFHPSSAWRGDGMVLDSLGALVPIYAPTTLDARKDRYIELDAANVFQLGQVPAQSLDGLFLDTKGSGTGQLAPKTYVLCDAFEVPGRRITQPDRKPVSPGTPILYYKATPSYKTIVAPADPQNRTYNSRDNIKLIGLGRLTDAMGAAGTRRLHPLDPLYTQVNLQDPPAVDFYDYIRDPTVTSMRWPYRPDSYILISAGPDGLYGTPDDIRNFGKK